MKKYFQGQATSSTDAQLKIMSVYGPDEPEKDSTQVIYLKIDEIESLIPELLDLITKMKFYKRENN